MIPGDPHGLVVDGRRDLRRNSMGRIVSNFFMSLDGVVESPHEWHFPYFDDEMGAIVDEGVASSTAFLMGRKLYDEWSSY
jgi:dihydrofolate reductase